MLENQATLRTFRLSQPPDTPGPIQTTPLQDHRIDYLEYEGPVSGNRGTVERWDRGEYELLEEEAGRLSIRFSGERLNGTAILSQLDEEWEFLLEALPTDSLRQSK